MFEDFTKKLAQTVEGIGDAIEENIKSNGEMYDDPLAREIEWLPLKRGGSNFQTHEYYEANGVAGFKPTKGNILFAGVFMAIGSIVPLSMLISAVVGGNFNLGTLIGVGIGIVFFVVGFVMYRYSTKPIVFDKGLGYYYKGKIENSDPAQIEQLDDSCRLSEIKAIQIISEYVRDSSSSSSDTRSTPYYSYEINLVLADATRLNVVDHGKQRTVFRDADTLSRFLEVPVWKNRRLF